MKFTPEMYSYVLAKVLPMGITLGQPILSDREDQLAYRGRIGNESVIITLDSNMEVNIKLATKLVEPPSLCVETPEPEYIVFPGDTRYEVISRNSLESSLYELRFSHQVEHKGESYGVYEKRWAMENEPHFFAVRKRDEIIRWETDRKQPIDIYRDVALVRASVDDEDSFGHLPYTFSYLNRMGFGHILDQFLADDGTTWIYAFANNEKALMTLETATLCYQASEEELTK